MIKKMLSCLNLFVLINISLLPINLVDAAEAQANPHYEIEQRVGEILERFKSILTPKELTELSPEKAVSLLTDDEKDYLSKSFVHFSISQPAKLYVTYDSSAGETPFWLPLQGFQPEPELNFIVSGEDPYVTWSKDFPKGEIKLGIPGFSGEMKPYIVFIEKQDTNQPIHITPALKEVDVITAQIGERLFLDDDDDLTTAPDKFIGLPVLRSFESWEFVSRMVGFFRMTDYPSSNQPDHFNLTWQGDPKTSITIQWRTNDSIDSSEIWYGPKSAFITGEQTHQQKADVQPLTSRQIVNDATIHLHRARLEGLSPATDYAYAVTTDGGKSFSKIREFRTSAETGDEPYSFIYLGDPQNGLDQWGELIRQSEFRFPDARFYTIAGDLIDHGTERDNWDQFFHEGSAVFDESVIVPAIGNHDSHGGHPTLYLKQFALPNNGTPNLDPGRTYFIEYQDLLVVVMDSNYDLIEPELQVEWLDETLGNSNATWKTVIYHHPFYASRSDRDNVPLRDAWGAIFDKHEVDIAFQGHDHAYMRTVPMKNHRPAPEGEHGTIYLVAVSGTKMYDQKLPDFAAFGTTNTRTFQIIQVDPKSKSLTYQAIDSQGKVIDFFQLDK